MVFKMAGPKVKRIKQLSKDTATCMHQTCYGLVDLYRYLLNTTQNYVLLGQFTSDHLEKEYSILHQGSGGIYFLSVQQVIKKLCIKHASLLLKLNVDIDNFNVKSGHQCALCHYKLSEDCCEILDILQDLESSIADDVKMSLIHITGYLTQSDKERTDYELLDQTTFYYQKYGQFSTDHIFDNRTTDNSCQWTFFCFVIFQIVKDHVCRKSLSSIFMIISDYYSLDMEEHHCVILSNI